MDWDGLIADYAYQVRMKAYMFINSMRGQSLALTRAIRGVGGVLAADAITGDYDVIASVEVRDLTELRTAMAAVQSLDGVLKTTTAMAGSMATSGGKLRLGGNNVWGQYFNGFLDDVRIYNRALSSADISLLSSASSTVAPIVTPTGPVISAVTAVAGADNATITWTTNQTTDSQVEYGLTPSYGSSATVNATLVTSHSQGLTSLAPGAVYHYRVKSRNAAGTLATSSDLTFQTPAAPAKKTRHKRDWLDGIFNGLGNLF